jgi:hypothetical protein
MRLNTSYLDKRRFDTAIATLEQAGFIKEVRDDIRTYYVVNDGRTIEANPRQEG